MNGSLSPTVAPADVLNVPSPARHGPSCPRVNLWPRPPGHIPGLFRQCSQVVKHWFFLTTGKLQEKDVQKKWNEQSIDINEPKKQLPEANSGWQRCRQPFDSMTCASFATAVILAGQRWPTTTSRRVATNWGTPKTNQNKGFLSVYTPKISTSILISSSPCKMDRNGSLAAVLRSNHHWADIFLGTVYSWLWGTFSDINCFISVSWGTWICWRGP